MNYVTDTHSLVWYFTVSIWLPSTAPAEHCIYPHVTDQETL
ncbi:MAG: hypothetical protein XU11_C0038G0012 [Candidatus Dadabacteria bacterium CSP1-2]|nr:MAG: hypothetical protein XU11_C0038G0012 [Candidatus Dadabacteria bacterium CSP1-2]